MFSPAWLAVVSFCIHTRLIIRKPILNDTIILKIHDSSFGLRVKWLQGEGLSSCRGCRSWGLGTESWQGVQGNLGDALTQPEWRLQGFWGSYYQEEFPEGEGYGWQDGLAMETELSWSDKDSKQRPAPRQGTGPLTSQNSHNPVSPLSEF